MAANKAVTKNKKKTARKAPRKKAVAGASTRRSSATRKVAKKAAKKKATQKKTAKKSTRKVGSVKTSATKKAVRKKAATKKVAKKKAAKRKVASKATSARKTRKKTGTVAKKTSSKTTAAAKKAAGKRRPSRKRPTTKQLPARSRSTAAKQPNVLTGPVRGFQPYRPRRGEAYMTEKQLKHFSSLLNAWKTELMEEVDRTMLHMKDDAANFPDPNDRATQESEFGLELRTRDRERKLLKKIASALQRVDEQTYGYCEETGEEIGLRRLEARPVATLCVEAQERRERAEKQYRDHEDHYR